MKGKGWDVPDLQTEEGKRVANEAIAMHAWGDTDILSWASTAVDPNDGQNHEATRWIGRKMHGGPMVETLMALRAREMKEEGKGPAREDCETLARFMGETRATMDEARTARLSIARTGAKTQWPVEATRGTVGDEAVRIEGISPWNSPDTAREVLSIAMSLWYENPQDDPMENARQWSAALTGHEIGLDKDIPIAWDACTKGAQTTVWIEHQIERQTPGSKRTHKALRNATWKGKTGEIARLMLADERKWTSQRRETTKTWTDAIMGNRANVHSEEARRIRRHLDAKLLENTGDVLGDIAQILGEETDNGCTIPIRTGRKLVDGIMIEATRTLASEINQKERKELARQAQTYAEHAQTNLIGNRGKTQEEKFTETAIEAIRRIAREWTIGRDGALRETNTKSTIAQCIAEEMEYAPDTSAGVPYGEPLRIWAIIGRATGPSAATIDEPEGTSIVSLRNTLLENCTLDRYQVANLIDGEETIRLANRIEARGGSGHWNAFIEDAETRRKTVRAGGQVAKPGVKAAEMLRKKTNEAYHWTDSVRAARRCVKTIHEQYTKVTPVQKEQQEHDDDDRTQAKSRDRSRTLRKRTEKKHCETPPNGKSVK